MGVRITISIIIFIVISNTISVQFVEIKCAEDDHTLKNSEKKLRLDLASYVYNINTSSHSDIDILVDCVSVIMDCLFFIY